MNFNKKAPGYIWNRKLEKTQKLNRIANKAKETFIEFVGLDIHTKILIPKLSIAPSKIMYAKFIIVPPFSYLIISYSIK